ncbi:hypothetical protein COO60DRAFT_1504105 [Scenedesmus sp. NREL 46B-D3]|nr:hypothetical protein COO60DRAFT_1504105 [Scenedesmus sp. NREL 46B-D3]
MPGFMYLILVALLVGLHIHFSNQAPLLLFPDSQRLGPLTCAQQQSTLCYAWLTGICLKVRHICSSARTSFRGQVCLGVRPSQRSWVLMGRGRTWMPQVPCPFPGSTRLCLTLFGVITQIKSIHASCACSG